jgi:predicted RNase H-like HicB family nuclease
MSMAERLVSPEGEARTDMKRYYNLSYVIYGPEQSTEPDKFMAEIPALPGCRAWGDTPGETIEILESLAPAFIELQLERGENGDLIEVFPPGSAAQPVNSNLVISV